MRSYTFKGEEIVGGTEGLRRDKIIAADSISSQIGPDSQNGIEGISGNHSKSRSTPFGGPAYRLYHDSGKLNPRILDLAGVPIEKRAEVQERIERQWDSFSREFEARAELIEPGDDDREIGTYRVAGSTAVAKVFKENLLQEISPIAGRGGANLLIQYLDSASNFAGLGRYDVELKLFYSESKGEQVKAVRYKVTDPKDGRQIANGGTSEPIGYWRRFGNAFMIEKN